MTRPSTRSFTMPAALVAAGLITGALVLSASGAQGIPTPATAPAAAPMTGGSSEVGDPSYFTNKQFMRITGIKGESTTRGFVDQIELGSISGMVSAEAAFGAQGAWRVGRAAPSPLVVTKDIDRATPDLMSRAASGKALGTVVIATTTTSQSQEGAVNTVLRITLSNAVVSSITTEVDANVGLQREKLTLIFSTITYDYFQANPQTGAVPTTPTSTVTWEIATGKVS